MTSPDVLKLISTSVIKSCPLHHVPASVFKQRISVLVPVITAIINKSICSGVVQHCLKLMYISKLTEKVVAKKSIEGF